MKFTAHFTNKKFLAYGLTLIELLITIAVVGVLATVILVVINPNTQFQKTRDAQRKSDLQQIRKALEPFYSDWQEYPCFNDKTCPTGRDLVYKLGDGSYSQPASLDTSYIVSIPNDPTIGKACPGYLYAMTNKGQNYTLFANLEYTQDPAATALKNKPGIGGTCNGQVGNQCKSYTFSGGACGTAPTNTYNYWINIP